MAESKTEKPTPRRRQKAREQGNVARSRDLSGILALSGAFAVVAWQGYSGIEVWRSLLRQAFEFSGSESLTPAAPLFLWTACTLAKCVLPVMATAWTLSLAGGLAQGGLVFAPEALIPKIERFSPAGKLKQMFSLTGLSNLLKSLLPFTAIAYIGFATIRDHWIGIVLASNTSVWTFVRFVLTALFEVAWKSALMLLIWALVDYFLTWRKSESDMRMSREEMKQETKDSDGNPQVKMRIRRLQRQMRKQLMLHETERATVVVTNPTHFAVAILYTLDMSAPIVVAKGRNLLAQKMKQIARWKDIPVLENPPLAQALYKTVDVGQSIPAKLYTAVAEVLAFVYRAQAQVRRQAQPGVETR